MADDGVADDGVADDGVADHGVAKRRSDGQRSREMTDLRNDAVADHGVAKRRSGTKNRELTELAPALTLRASYRTESPDSESALVVQARSTLDLDY